jgi:endonuclease/exonuclease/phosphatase family metal-dependent hydrolase
MIRVLTWNIHKGFGMANGLLTVDAMRAALDTVDADLVLMQEVVGRHDRHAERLSDWPELPQAEFLAGTRWSQFAYAANAWHQHGHHGNALLSRHPILDWENLDLTNHRWERRGVLHARVRVPRLAKPLHVLCTHLDLLHRGRVRQVERIAERIRAAVPAGEPLLLAGDFNDWGQRLGVGLERDLGLREAHHAVHGRAARSFPARFPLLPLDRLYVRGLDVRSAQVLSGARWERLSDHAPLLASLGLP